MIDESDENEAGSRWRCCRHTGHYTAKASHFSGAHAMVLLVSHLEGDIFKAIVPSFSPLPINKNYRHMKHIHLATSENRVSKENKNDLWPRHPHTATVKYLFISLSSFFYVYTYYFSHRVWNHTVYCHLHFHIMYSENFFMPRNVFLLQLSWWLHCILPYIYTKIYVINPLLLDICGMFSQFVLTESLLGNILGLPSFLSFFRMPTGELTAPKFLARASTWWQEKCYLSQGVNQN